MDAIAEEVGRRRTFAIISHPDAGKTTLTEKLLLYGGAIREAGSVKARRASRHVTSDWMEMEKERGISVTSSVLQFNYDHFRVNLLDTPGHKDFSEDTYRTLVAADSAVMLLDNRRGVEEQTRKLFKVCKLRRIPIITFVNKCDRAGELPLKLLDDVEGELGMGCVPFTWPITRGEQFLGVYDRQARQILLFDRGADHGAHRSTMEAASLDGPEIREALGEEAHDRLKEEIELLDVAGAEYTQEAFLAGEVSPTFFGSALTNFGVEPFLQAFLDMVPPPTARRASTGPVDPLDPAFTAFVFKIQANMDPKHRDRVAFIRVCSGRYAPGAVATNVRSGKDLRLAAAQQFFARERTAVEEAWAGDVVGVLDRGNLRIGDTLAEGGQVEFEDIPRFSPEHFAKIHVPDPLRRKHLDTGLRHLSEEGAAQVFYRDGSVGPEPVVGAVGMLQYDVLLHRLRGEYGVEARLEPLPYRLARWVTGDEKQWGRVAGATDRALVFDAKDQPVVLFASDWSLRIAQERAEDVEFHEVAP